MNTYIRPHMYQSDLVTVCRSDHEDMADVLVVTLAGFQIADADADIAPLSFECSSEEARELIAGLAALL